MPKTKLPEQTPTENFEIEDPEMNILTPISGAKLDRETTPEYLLLISASNSQLPEPKPDSGQLLQVNYRVKKQNRKYKNFFPLCYKPSYNGDCLYE